MDKRVPGLPPGSLDVVSKFRNACRGRGLFAFIFAGVGNSVAVLLSKLPKIDRGVGP
jgi:hypothetical protein